jgi:hypothetical protein
VTHTPYARAPDPSVTLSRTAGQYLTLFFHQHTEAKDVITSKNPTLIKQEAGLDGFGEQKNLAPTGIEAETFHPVVSLYNDYAILAE